MELQKKLNREVPDRSRYVANRPFECLRSPVLGGLILQALGHLELDQID